MISTINEIYMYCMLQHAKGVQNCLGDRPQIFEQKYDWDFYQILLPILKEFGEVNRNNKSWS